MPFVFFFVLFSTQHCLCTPRIGTWNSWSRAFRGIVPCQHKFQSIKSDHSGVVLTFHSTKLSIHIAALKIKRQSDQYDYLGILTRYFRGYDISQLTFSCTFSLWIWNSSCCKKDINICEMLQVRPLILRKVMILFLEEAWIRNMGVFYSYIYIRLDTEIKKKSQCHLANLSKMLITLKTWQKSSLILNRDIWNSIGYFQQ